MTDVYFYISKEYWKDDFPAADDFTWEGYGFGVYCWVLQTYNKLKNAGHNNYHLCNEIPDEGIIISHRGALEDSFKPNSKQLLFCMQADWGRHPYAQAHSVQNNKQTFKEGTPTINRYLQPGPSYYTRLWPQPGLQGRDNTRGDSFENVAYLGNPENLAAGLRSAEWKASLDALGVNWLIETEVEKWIDYSNVDCMVAVRSFDYAEHLVKPANKLYNAWLAGIPAILGHESAYQYERKSEYDYLEVVSVEDAYEAVKKLKQDADYRNKMIANGQQRAAEIQDSKLVDSWVALIEDKLKADYERWRSCGALKRQWFFMNRHLARFARKIKPS